MKKSIYIISVLIIITSSLIVSPFLFKKKIIDSQEYVISFKNPIDAVKYLSPSFINEYNIDTAYSIYNSYIFNNILELENFKFNTLNENFESNDFDSIDDCVVKLLATYVVKFRTTIDLNNFLSSDNIKNEIEYIETVKRIVPAQNTEACNNDMRDQESMRIINAKGIDSLIYGQFVKIAVIDGGVDTNHFAISKSIIANNVNNKKVISAINNSTNLSDESNGHGTHVTGIIAASCCNKLERCGIAPLANIINIKVLGKDGGSNVELARGIALAIMNNVKIINLSIEFEKAVQSDTLISRALNCAFNKNIVIVIAAGNHGGDTKDHFPASYANAIIVGNSTNDGKRFYKSNNGNSITIFAPGVEVLSTTPFKSFEKKTGTSMSAPLVSGIIALMLQKNKKLTFSKIKQIIQKSSTRTNGIDVINAALCLRNTPL
jgi:subtilisin family serine protease